MDALEGNDRFFIASTNENVIVEIIGGLGSDTFHVSGGTGDQPVTVVSNGLEGHSGLIGHDLFSTDGNFHDVYVQDLPVKVADNDAAGIVINQVDGPIRVFEKVLDSVAAGVFVRNSYTVVLTRSPRETVRVTAAPVALSETESQSGGKNIMLNGSDLGATLFFDRTNWFIPQTITVSAHRDTSNLDDDVLAQGSRSVVIQHSVVEGASVDDRSEYDNLAVLSVVADVIDDDSADVVVVPSNNEFFGCGRGFRRSAWIRHLPCGTFAGSFQSCHN